MPITNKNTSSDVDPSNADVARGRLLHLADVLGHRTARLHDSCSQRQCLQRFAPAARPRPLAARRRRLLERHASGTHAMEPVATIVAIPLVYVVRNRGQPWLVRSYTEMYLNVQTSTPRRYTMSNRLFLSRSQQRLKNCLGVGLAEIEGLAVPTKAFTYCTIVTGLETNNNGVILRPPWSP